MLAKDANEPQNETQSKTSKEKSKLKQKKSPKIDSKLAKEILTKIAIHRGSITDLNVDCVVNAANGGLWAGAGVCGAIFRAAGSSKLKKECDAISEKYGQIETGCSVITKGYKLSAKHIIHSVGPTSENHRALAQCYESALELCILHNIRSIAFPCISTGIGFDKEIAAPVALKAVREWMIEAKKSKYMERIALIKEKKELKEKETMEKKKNKKDKKWIWGNDDNENENDQNNEVEHDEWNDDDNEQKGNDTSEDVVDMNKNDDDKNKQSDKTEIDKMEINLDENETVLDRIDSIIFCCFDIGNWHLYKEQTPKIFPSTNKDHSYLWSDKVKRHKESHQKQKKGSKI